MKAAKKKQTLKFYNQQSKSILEVCALLESMHYELHNYIDYRTLKKPKPKLEIFRPESSPADELQ